MNNPFKTKIITRPVTRSITKKINTHTQLETESMNKYYNEYEDDTNSNNNSIVKRLRTKIKNKESINNNYINKTTDEKLITIGNENKLTESGANIHVNTNNKNNIETSRTIELLDKANVNNEQQNLRRSDTIKNKSLIKQINLTKEKAQCTNNDNIRNSNIHLHKLEEQNKNTEIENGKKQKLSAIHRYQEEINHRIDSTNSETIWTETNKYKLLIKQSLLINAYQPELNKMI